MRQGRKKGDRPRKVSRRGIGTEPGRLWDQDPRPSRGERQAHGAAAHGRPPSRAGDVRAVDGAGSGETGTYRKRNVVERLINRLKQFRRIATRYEKRALNYLAMLTVAAITL